MEPEIVSRIGRPRSEIDYALALSMLPSLSIRRIAKQIGVHHNTLSHRLRRDGHTSNETNPLCMADRGLMHTVKTADGRPYFRCAVCRVAVLAASTRKRIGRPLKDFDYAKASEHADRSVMDIAKSFGVHRNTVHRRIARGLIIRRPRRSQGPRLPRRTREGFALYWPYMKVDDPRYEGPLRAVNEAVPRSLADEVRADVCQEILLSVLSGELLESEIHGAIKRYIQFHRRLFPVRGYQTVSLDSQIRGTDLTIIETLNAEDVAERIADAWAASRLTERDRKTTAHFHSGRRRDADRVPLSQYDHFRRKYQLMKSRRIRVSEYEIDQFGGAWSVETALPDERRA